MFLSYAPLSRLPEGVWHTTTYCVAAPACCAVYVVFAISCVVCCVVMFCCVFELCSSLSCQRVCGTLLLWPLLLHRAACSDVVLCVMVCVLLLCCGKCFVVLLSRRVCGTLLLWRLLHPAACSDKRSQKLPITTRGATPAAVQLPINPSPLITALPRGGGGAGTKMLLGVGAG